MSKWVSVTTTGTTCRTEVQPAPPPPKLEAWSAPPPVMSTTFKLVVAAMSDVAALESAGAWSELPAIDLAHLAVLRCLFEGEDPNTPLEPIDERKNPFTGEVHRRTVLDRSHDSFEVLFDGDFISGEKAGELAMDGHSFDDATVLRIPSKLVARISELSEATMIDTARRWAEAWSAIAKIPRRAAPPLSEADARRGLEALVPAAKLAASKKHELLLYTPG